MPYTLTIQQKKSKSGDIYYPLRLNLVPKPSPGPGELLVKLEAAALNHRDLFIRKHLYPDISFKSPLLCDGYGIVVEVGSGCVSSDHLLNQPVLLTPGRGWHSDPTGPEDPSQLTGIGGIEPHHHLGAAQNYVVVEESEVEPCPPHLSPTEGAALPACGLTGWRALVTKSGNAEPGRNILITGIGGGVALQTLQFGVALGCNMYVTSGSQDKIDKAQQLGAKGGVIYKNEDWHLTLQKMLPVERPFLDAVVDGAGGSIVMKTVPLLKIGGIISCYGMTTGPSMDWTMPAVLKNIELRGSTFGSRLEFRDMLNFVKTKEIRPIVSRTVKGLDCVDAIDGLFEDMKTGKQFGKLVIEI
ncbi:oxidoreductase [Nemania serpens]|nr:oxidoreductase [Nemania serpens]